MWGLTVFLSIIWALSLLYGEWVAYLMPSLWTCSWPHLQPQASSLPNGIDPSSKYVKVAVVTDPQLMDRTSLALAPKSIALEIAQFYTDLYMRRAFFSSVLPFYPDIILFLGDYFDGGQILSDEEWQESLARLRHIFNLNVLQKRSSTKLYFLSGNHDIGYTFFNSRKLEIVKRHEREFGMRNFKITIGRVEFIAVDAQTLDGQPSKELTLESWNFVKNVSKDTYSNPRVLLTHIPLYRSDWTPCGPYRSSPIINQRVRFHDQEIAYQNYITESSSNALLELIRPLMVISGHDHDQCTVTHMSKHGPVTEHTVGTISWQQGNLYPSFMLLSARSSTFPISDEESTSEDAISTHVCFLPMQTHIYLWYLSLLIMTIVIALIWPANEVLISRKFGRLVSYIRNLLKSFSSVVKEKDEDENCEYEEIWDAEGTMHLIKKTRKAPRTSVNGSSVLEWGNAMMRSTVRKTTVVDTDASTPEVSIHMGPTRTNKSRAKIVIWRLLRSLRAVLIVAALNVPLYIFLLFKDWIDK